jgi:hypothetical protein
MQHRRTGSKLAPQAASRLGHPPTASVALKLRDLALFDLALDSKLRACDRLRSGSLIWSRMAESAHES